MIKSILNNMSQLPDLDIIEKIFQDYKFANNIFRELLHQFQDYLKLKQISGEIQVIITDAPPDDSSDIFNFGILKEKFNDRLIIRKNQESLRFLPFIFVREILRCFMEKELRDNLSINLALNQMVMTILSKHPYINEWKSKIREEVEKISRIYAGFNYLTNFDRLDRFFNVEIFKFKPNPIHFFIKYLNEHPQLAKSKFNTFNYMFLKKYKEKMLNLMTNDNLVETLRIIILIFYNIKNSQKSQKLN